MSRNLILFFSTFLLFGFLGVGNAKADEVPMEVQVEVEEESEYDLKISEDTVLTFDSVEAKEAYIQSNNDLNPENNNSKLVKGVSPAAGYFDKLVATYKPNQVFGGYITKNWTKASSHTIGAGRSYSFSGSYSGIGLSFSYKQSVSSTLPANKTRYSKLGMYADYTIQKYKQNTPNLSTPNYYYKKTVRSSYVNVVYK